MVLCKQRKLMDSPNYNLGQVPGVSVHFFPSLDEIQEEWANTMPADNLFFQPAYLLTLEKAPPTGVKFGYLIFRKNGKNIGGAILQVQYFKANQNINYQEEAAIGFFGTLSRFFRNLVASKVEFYTIICGNMMLTGEYGFAFKKNALSPKEELKALDEGLSFAQQQYEQKGIPIAGNLLKDFFHNNHEYSNQLTNIGYHEFQVQPNMILPKVNRWKDFDHYLSDVTSKYRVRYRRARKKAGELKRVELSESEIIEKQALMHNMYNEVAENSGFNLVNLNKEYLIELKRNLGNRFKVYGYFQGDSFVGFNSTIANGTELEAHFLGFVKKVNKESQLYLNMLYDILEEGIVGGFHDIVFARTAMEIKSSLGAQGYDMNCYLKHQNSFTNKLLPSILSVLKPEKDWVPRNPFKEITSGF